MRTIITTIIGWPNRLVNLIRAKIRHRRKMKDLAKRDPFIYK